MISDNIEILSDHNHKIRWSVQRVPKKGESQCGDVSLVTKHKNSILIAVIDGLGHGDSAVRASLRAKHLLETYDDRSLINMVNHCHKNLRNTRGVVMSLARIDMSDNTLTWMGVGNVEGTVLHKDQEEPERIVSRHGIVGYNISSLKASIIPILVGDVLILSTDGVKKGYISKVNTKQSTQQIVKYIGTNYFDVSDDSLTLVAKVTGAEEIDG